MKLFFLLLTTVSFFGFGCTVPSFSRSAVEEMTRSAAERATGGKVNIASDKGTVEFADQKGHVVAIGAQANLPEGFPTDVPRYPGSTLVAASKTDTEHATLSVQTSDDSAKVLSWMEMELKKNGWILKTTMGGAAFQTRTFEKATSTLSVTTVPDGDGNGGTMLTMGRE